MLHGKKLRPFTVIIVVVIAGSFLVNHFLVPSKMDIETKLKITVEEFNKKCPIMLNEETRCDSAETPAPRTFQYNLTLVTVQDGSEADTNNFKLNVFPGLLKAFKANPETKFFRDDNVTIISSYHDAKGNFIFKSIIRPEDYK